MNFYYENYLIFFIIGALFLLFEAIVPGIGVLGLCGLIFMIIGIVIASPSLFIAIILIIALIMATIIVFILFFKNAPKSLILTKSSVKEDGYSVSKDNSEYIGKIVKTSTILKPSGKVSYDGNIFDAVTEGDYIDSDTKVKVIYSKGSILVVKKLEE